MIYQLLNGLEKEITQIIKALGVEENIDVFFETPKDTSFGDYSTNIAMRLAKHLRKNPVMIAKEISEKIDLKKHHLVKTEVAGAGFINLFIDRNYLANIVFDINFLKADYGCLHIGDENINLEFVSANPTGYLHIGHGRGAAYGDSLARTMRKAGYNVSCEHYVNDGGNQIKNLANSINQRYKQLFKQEFQLGADDYHGSELIEIAKQIKQKHGNRYLNEPWFEYFLDYGINYLLEGLKKDLADFNVFFDTWFSEKSLYDQGEVDKTLQKLISDGYTYEMDGAIWLKTSDFNDEKDRVIVKSDGSLTYLTPDIAYHANKLARGFDRLINVLGADHHGYINRLKAAIACIGGNPDKVDIEILQMVRVIQNGQEIKMSKRSGKAITLRDLIDEIGSDALRFMYVSKALSTPMDLDLDLLIKKSNDNPVYYVQYAYARICSLFKTLETNNQVFKEVKEFKTLDVEKIDKIVMALLQYPLVIEEAATKRIPHKIAQYATTLATAVHSYYNDEKIITEDIEQTNEKLTLFKAVQIVLKDSLSLIGVGIKEKM